MRVCTHKGGAHRQWVSTFSLGKTLTNFLLYSGRDSNLWSWNPLDLKADALPVEPPRPRTIHKKQKIISGSVYTVCMVLSACTFFLFIEGHLHRVTSGLFTCSNIIIHARFEYNQRELVGTIKLSSFRLPNWHDWVRLNRADNHAQIKKISLTQSPREGQCSRYYLVSKLTSHLP